MYLFDVVNIFATCELDDDMQIWFTDICAALSIQLVSTKLDVRRFVRGVSLFNLVQPANTPQHKKQTIMIPPCACLNAQQSSNYSKTAVRPTPARMKYNLISTAGFGGALLPQVTHSPIRGGCVFFSADRFVRTCRACERASDVRRTRI